MAKIIQLSDLRQVVPGSVSDVELNTTVEDVNALLAVRVPCLSTATKEVLAAAKALIRQRLRHQLSTGGAKSISLAQGPFSQSLTFGGDGSGSLVDDDLVSELRALCDPAYGAKMALVDMNYVEHIPSTYGYCPDETSLPDLRWW